MRSPFLMLLLFIGIEFLILILGFGIVAPMLVSANSDILVLLGYIVTMSVPALMYFTWEYFYRA